MPETVANSISGGGRWPNSKLPRCKAKSRQSGNRCKRFPHPGSTVCVIHGAGAPQVRKKSKRRIEELNRPTAIKMDKFRTISIDDLSARTARMILKDLDLRDIRRERASRKKLLSRHCFEAKER